MWRAVALALLALSCLPVRGFAETPSDTALALIAQYHEDTTRLDRAREILETALKTERRVETLIALSHVYLLIGDVRARSTDEKLEAYERGRDIGRRAIELAPKSEEAHLWYVANTGRWGQTKGVVRSLFLLPTMREELDTILALNPRSAPGHAIAGTLMFEVPGLLGGDRAKAEEHYKKSIDADPRYTLPRVDLARLLIATGRYADARRELRRVLDERAPRSLADWTVKDAPRARELLDSIKDRR
jgi:tetratricopeptide (TPR) repeat protein